MLNPVYLGRTWSNPLGKTEPLQRPGWRSLYRSLQVAMAL